MKPSSYSFLIFFLVFFSSIFISETLAQTNEVDILFQQKIPMRDGINLSANIYKPSEMDSPLPVILMITPYVSYFNPEYGPYFAKRGYVFAYVDIRGRGNSEGIFAPLENDGKDGYDVVEWLAKQPWSNGKIGMMGQSLRGAVQWSTLKEFPPSLCSIAPTASAVLGIVYPYNNIFPPYLVQWLSLVAGKTNNIKIFQSDYWRAKSIKIYKEHLPFSTFDKITGIDGRIFQKWIKHPTYDKYWEEMVPSKNEYEKMSIPVLTITGYFDNDQPGALHYYNNYMKYASEEAKKMHYLVIGPWNHFGTIFPESEIGGLKFGENAVIDIKKLHLDWFNWTLKGYEKPAAFEDNVNYYIMGINEWRYARSLESISNESMKFFLSSDDGKANDVFHSGNLELTYQIGQIPDTIIYDPLDISSADVVSSENYMLDQSEAFQNCKLIYHSLPFKNDVVIAGNIRVNLFLQINTPDTDIQFNLYEIKSSGESIFLTSDMMRARFRESLKKEKLIKPDEINLYEFDSKFLIVRKIDKNSRLRLVFSTLNSPDYQKNYNSGGDVSFETSKDAQTAIIRLFHNEEYPSNIMLPILKKNL